MPVLTPKSMALLATAAAVLCAASAHAAGRVEVKYIKPDQFSDAGRFGMDRERTMKSLTEYMQTLGQRLPDGQTLKLEVQDIDLAGELRPGHSGQEIRVLRGRADWPRMTLHYSLEAAGRVLKSGDAKLDDMAYQQTGLANDMRYGDLPYEKHMVEKWFDKTIIGH